MLKRIVAIVCLAANISLCYSQSLVPIHNDNGKFGYGVKGTKDFTIAPQWDEAKPFNDKGIAVVRKGDKYGIITRSGTPIGAPLGYSMVAPYDGTDYLLVAVGGKRVDDVSKITNRANLSAFGFKGSTSYPIKGAKWGLMNSNGSFIIMPEYQELSNLMGGKFVAVQKKNLLGYVNIENMESDEMAFDVMTPFNNQGLASKRNKKTRVWSVVNKDGKVIIGEDKNLLLVFQYEGTKDGNVNLLDVDTLMKHKEMWNDGMHLLPLNSEGLTWINTDVPYLCGVTRKSPNSKTLCYTLYNEDGTEIIPMEKELSFIGKPSCNTAFVARNNSREYGFYNLTDGSFSPTDGNRHYSSFENGYAVTHKPNGGASTDYYLIDTKGQCVSDRYDWMQATGDKYLVKKNNKFGIISSTGETLVPLQYTHMHYSDNGFFAAKNEQGLYGWIDGTGQTLIPFQYDQVIPFIGQYAIACKNHPTNSSLQCGVIDTNNKVIIPLRYENVMADVDKDGNLKAWVRQDGKYHSYNLNNGTLSQSFYTDMKIMPWGLLTKNEREHYGLIIDGEEIIPCSIEDAELIPYVYSYIQENGLKNLTSAQARSIAVRSDKKRNSFKISDKIKTQYWDY